MTTESTIKVSFELGKRDIKYFRDRLERTQVKRSDAADAKVIETAADLVKEALAEDVPEFVSTRLETLQSLIEMVRDANWRLEGRDRSRVLDALAYFADPEDLIPDRIPGIGYIDDAIMIELISRELKHELQAYQDFCEFRRQAKNRKDLDKTEARRRSLQRRMRRRRQSDHQRQRSRRPRSSLRLW